MRALSISVILLVLTSCSVLNKSDSVRGYTKMSPKEKSSFDRLFYSANKEKILGNYDEAAGLFSECLRKDPNNAASNYELANLYLMMGKHKESIYFSRRAASVDPTNLYYQFFLAEAYKRSKLFDKAGKVYREMVKLYPDNLDIRFELAGVLRADKEYAKAIDEYNRIEGRLGIVEEVSLQKELIYIHMNKIDKAAAEMEKLITSCPDDSRYYSMLAELYLANNESEKALKTFDRLLEKMPDDPFAHIALGEYYRSNGEQEKYFSELAIAFKSQELPLDKKVEILLSNYSSTESFPELTAQVLELCKIMVATHPDDAKSHSMYGDYLYRENDLVKALEEYHTAVELDQDRFFVWRQILQVESEQKDFSALLRDSEIAIELFPNQSILYLYNGIANIQGKKWEAAIETLTRGITLTSDNNQLLSSFYSNLGDSYHSRRDTGMSDQSYDKALEYDPDNIYVLNNYSYYLSLRGEELQRAKAMSSKAVTIEPKNTSFLDTYGWILYMDGKYEKAKDWIGKALESGGDKRGIILEHYGDVLFKLGEIDDAVKYWEDAQSVGGGSELLNQKIEDRKLHEKP
ncbi:MAG TPA: tetratricopeptide repeat protein [Flavobacteriales bacterium]|nr:tetratricopeptide repeat protein [Flavobacteriales bacterium]